MGWSSIWWGRCFRLQRFRRLVLFKYPSQRPWDCSNYGVSIRQHQMILDVTVGSAYSIPSTSLARGREVCTCLSLLGSVNCSVSGCALSSRCDVRGHHSTGRLWRRLNLKRWNLLSSNSLFQFRRDDLKWMLSIVRQSASEFGPAVTVEWLDSWKHQARPSPSSLAHS